MFIPYIHDVVSPMIGIGKKRKICLKSCKGGWERVHWVLASHLAPWLKGFKGILLDMYECAQKSCLGVNFMAQWDQKVTKKGIFLTILYRGFGWVPPVSLSICKSVSHTFSDFCPRLWDLTKRRNCGGRHGGQHGFESLYSLLSSWYACFHHA